jgi:sugar/nucleoside kinase (ribokinase family)
VGLFANACAALCCTKVGARAMSKRDEVMTLIKAQAPKGAGAF